MQGNNRPQSIKSEFISKKGNGLTIPRRTNASLASKKGNTVNKQTLKANKANNEKLKYSNQINDQKKANLPTTKTKSNKDWTQYFKELILALRRDASKDIPNLTNDEKMQYLNKLMEYLENNKTRDLTQIMKEIDDFRKGKTQHKSNKENPGNKEGIPKSNNYNEEDGNALVNEINQLVQQDNTQEFDKFMKRMKKSGIAGRKEQEKQDNDNYENPDWFRNTFLVRAKEILVLLSFIVGITFTVLIATGILGWGMLALGIFEAFGFLGASHLFGNLSLTDEYHTDGPNGESYWGNPLLKYKHKTGDKDEDEERLETISDILVVFKFIVFPLIFLAGGITLIILGNAGIIGLSLGLVLGIPSIIASLSALNVWMRKKENRGDKELRAGWRKFVFVTGILAVATFFVLSFTGVFALPVAVGFALPVIGFDLWTLAVKRIECCIRNREETEEEYDLSLPITEQNIYEKNKSLNSGRIPQFVPNQTQDKLKNGQ